MGNNPKLGYNLYVNYSSEERQRIIADNIEKIKILKAMNAPKELINWHCRVVRQCRNAEKASNNK